MAWRRQEMERRRLRTNERRADGDGDSGDNVCVIEESPDKKPAGESWSGSVTSQR